MIALNYSIYKRAGWQPIKLTQVNSKMKITKRDKHVYYSTKILFPEHMYQVPGQKEKSRQLVVLTTT